MEDQRAEITGHHTATAGIPTERGRVERDKGLHPQDNTNILIASIAVFTLLLVIMLEKPGLFQLFPTTACNKKKKEMQ